MSAHEVMQGLASLGPQDQAQVSAYLFHLRHAADEEYQASVQARLADREPAHWLTPEEFERRLDLPSPGDAPVRGLHAPRHRATRHPQILHRAPAQS